MSNGEGPSPAVRRRLGYLLKHAYLQMAEISEAAVARYGITARELPVLLVLADGEPASQQQAAQGLGVDRTTMVGLLDTLERKGLVARHPHADDRRRNVVELTAAGHDTLRLAVKANDEAERAFLAPLGTEDVEQLRKALHALVSQA